MPTRREAGLGLLSILLSCVTVLAPVGPSAAAPKPPSVSVADPAAVTEGSSATAATAIYTVSLKRGNGKKVKVFWSTADGTAKAGQDYVAASGKLRFKGPAKKQTQTVSIRIVGDDVVETTETFLIKLTKIKNGVLKRSTATATIKNDDTTTPPGPKTLTVTRTGTGSGTVTSEPAGIDCGTDCTETLEHGTTVTLTAASGVTSDFTGWAGDCAGELTNVCTLTMTATKNVGATFDSATRTVTVTKQGGGFGTVTSTPAGIDCGASCAAAFTKASDVVLAAVPASGSTFSGWTGDCTGTEGCTLSMTTDRDVTAVFADIPDFSLGVSVTGTGSVTSSPVGISCPGDCGETYELGTSVTLAPVAGSGFRFDHWSGSCTGTAGCTVSMTQARDVQATFTAIPTFSLALTMGGQAGAGHVTSSPAGIDCTASCSAEFLEGTVVTLTATPAANKTFLGWTGDCSGTGECTVTMSSAHAVQAVFSPTTYPVVIHKAGTGSGTLGGTMVGINCGQPTCTVNPEHGQSVTLTATAASDSTFTGWTGDCTGTGSCQLSNVAAAKDVTATFTLKTYALTVSIGGSGTVTSSPGSISCPGTCVQSFDHGTSVVLTPVPGAGYQFFGWAGGGCTGTGTCTVSMTADRSPIAQFTIKTYTLSVSREGAGAGSVTSAPSGISCGTDCSEVYDHGTTVTLSANAAGGSTFAGWTGACTGTGSCTVSMTQARSVTATFNVQQRQLTVTKSGGAADAGTVTDTVFGLINCGSLCSTSYPHGTAVTLQAHTNDGSAHFTGWTGGGCESVGTDDCTVTMDQARSVNANFDYQTHVLGLTVNGPPGVAVDSDQVSRCTSEQVTCVYLNLTHGSVVVLRYLTVQGTHFVGWSGCTEVTVQNYCRVVMTSDPGVTATFASN
jgi:hypothetical protein